MRIRKNANLSSSMFSHASGAEALQTHVCQLNQSPWDVISFSHQDPLQFEGEDSFNGNGSLGDSVGAVESVAEAEERAVVKMKIDNMVIDDNNYYEMEVIPDQKGMLDEYYSQRKVLKSCEKAQCFNKKSNGKGGGGGGWHCKSEPKHGSSMCDRRSNLPKSYSSNTSSSDPVAASLGPSSSHSIKKPDKAAATTGARRSRGKSGKKGLPSNPNPYEFYYYSGFGPLWGKRRGDRGEGIKTSEGKDTENNRSSSSSIGVIAAAANTTPFCGHSPNTNNNIDGFDYVDEDGDDDEENGDNGKKRTRKPVKARSLKSLM